MTKKALLIAGQESETVSTLARNLIHVAGISLFARQMKQMKIIGVTEMHVITDWFTREFEKEIQTCRKRPEKVFIHSTKDAPLKLLEHSREGDSWFLLEEGVVLDDRMIAQVVDTPSPSALSLIRQGEFLEERTANGTPLQLEDCTGYFGSVAKLSHQTLSANVRKLGSLEGLPNALKAISRAEDCEIIYVTDIPLYITNRRREVDLVWLPVIRREDGDKGTDVLLDYTRKGVLDWPARFIHPPIENFIVKYLCKFPVTPNQVTLATGVLGFYVMYLFATGVIIPALIGAYMVGVFNGVDGKLAQVKMRQSKIGKFAHLIDKLMVYGWYIAIGIFLVDQYGIAPYVMSAALALFHLADEIQSEFFRRMANCQICDVSGFDRKFRLIGARRNTEMWALLPFALLDQWAMGFAFITIYAVITFFVHQVRIIYHLKNQMVNHSGHFADNFKKTKIF